MKMKACEVNQRMNAVYGEHVLLMTRKQVWYKRIRAGRKSVNNDMRPSQDDFVITSPHHHLVVSSSSAKHIFRLLEESLIGSRFY